MGLFDKKYCDVCGEKIGLLGNRKLEDGNLCKECAKKLSPWFNERRHSTLAEIKEQLDYREYNRARAAIFNISESYGSRPRLLIDKQNRWFTLANTDDLENENPDVLGFPDALGCELNIDESRNEIKQETSDGGSISYNPPRYEYSYSFDVTIRVKNKYFDEMSFNISNGYINTGEVRLDGGSQWIVTRKGNSLGGDMGVRKCNECIKLGNELKDAVDSIRDMAAKDNELIEQIKAGVFNGLPINSEAPVVTNASAGAGQGAEKEENVCAAPQKWFCPSCGGENSGKFCPNCGTPRP